MWEDIDQESENLDDTNEFDQDQCSFDAMSELLSEEEQALTDSDDDERSNATSNKEVDGQSDVDDDISIDFSSLKLSHNQSSTINHFELLNDVNQLMKKSRLLVRFMRNHTVTNEYIQKQMMSINGNKKTGVLVLDMYIRWNSSFLLLDRLILHKDVLNGIFAFPNNLFGLSEQQIKRLKSLAFNEQEWKLIYCLRNVLEPFLDSTVVLSGQKYPTMSLSFYIFRLLSQFLESNSNDDVITNALKDSLRLWFNYHCKEKLTPEQLKLMTVSIYFLFVDLSIIL